MKHYHEESLASMLLNSNHANMLLVRLAHWEVETKMAVIVHVAAFFIFNDSSLHQSLCSLEKFLEGLMDEVKKSFLKRTFF